MFGFLNIYKPSGITSFGVIARLKKVAGFKKIGHQGTLDPMACGVLPIAFGKAARLFEYMQDDKKYIAEFQLGYTSDTYDKEGTVITYKNANVITKEDLNNTLKIFKGDIEQKPPMFSAVHLNGKRLYEYARKGIEISDIPTRKVSVYDIRLLEFNEKEQVGKIFVHCSKGTYIRTIISDIGENLKAGAYMTALERISAGNFDSNKSIKLENITSKEIITKNLINPIDVLSYNNYKLTEQEFIKVRHGNPIKIQETSSNSKPVMLSFENELIAIGTHNINIIEVRKVLL